MERCAPSAASLHGAKGRKLVAQLQEVIAGFAEWRHALEIGQQTGAAPDPTQLEGGDFGFPAGKGADGLGAVDQINEALVDLHTAVKDPIGALDQAG